jgi:hypothetical protein
MFQINQYGAEGLALTPRPIIYTKDADLGQRRQECRSFDLPDQRICADRHPESAHQALAGTSSQGMPHRGDDLAGSLRLLCIWGANLGKTFGEDSPLATVVPATPATQTQPEDHVRALDRKVFQRTPIPAMARARDGLATRTGGRVLTVSFHGPTLVRPEHTAKRHVAQIGEEVCVR